MSYSERIIELFDEELKHRIDILMTQYADVRVYMKAIAENISKRGVVSDRESMRVTMVTHMDRKFYFLRDA